MHMYISSKVTHAKYAVAETRTSSVKRITVIHVLRKYLRPLLTMYFRIEFQGFKTHAEPCLMSKTDEDR